MASRTFTGALLVGLACLSLPLPSLAQSAENQTTVALLSADLPWPRLKWLRVDLNDIEVARDTLVMRPRPGAGLWVARESLQAWRLSPQASTSMAFEGADYVPLAAIEGLTYEIDERSQRLRLNAPADALSATHVGRRDSQNPEVSPRASGAYLNYDLAQRRVAGQTDRFGFFEAAHFNAWGVGLTRGIVGAGPDGDDTVRLDSAWIHDRPQTTTRLTLGDSISRGGMLGQNARFGGIQFGRDFSLQPHQRTFPVPSLSGEADVPSTVDLFINDQRRQRTPVPSGPFQFDNPPVISGAGQATIQITDPQGRTRVVTESFYVDPQLLRPGLSDYSVALGARRQRFGQASSDYAGLLANGLFRRGLNDWMTGELHGEVQDELYLLGAGVTLIPGIPASLNVGLGLAGYQGQQGWLAELGLQHVGPRFNAAVRVSASDTALTGAAADGLIARARRDLVATAGRQFGRNGVSLLVLERKPLIGADFRLLDLGVTRSFHWGGLIRLSAFQRDVGGATGKENGLRLTLSLPLGKRMTAGGTTETISGGASQHSAQLQRSLPFGRGTGYRLRHDENETGGRSAAEVQHRSAIGSHRLGIADSEQETAYEIGTGGAVGWIGNTPFASRRVDDGFALVELPGFANVDVYRENQQVATTNRHGRALIPDLRAYQTNRLHLDGQDLPLDAGVTSLQRVAVPAFRSGTVVEFPVRQARGAAFRLLLTSGQPVPAAAAVQVAGDERDFRVGNDGRTYVEDLAIGANRLTVRWAEGSCRFEVVLPDNAEPLPELGDIICHTISMAGG